MHHNDRKNLFAAAKLAVRAYAKDPSDNNAAQVQAAWKAVSDMETRSSWRQRQEEGIPRDEIEAAPSRALDDIEQQSAENRIMVGPPMGSA